jgi:hypothetical protein
VTKIKHLTLYVLKTHEPNVVEFATTLSRRDPACKIGIRVLEVDEKTETVLIDIEGPDIDFTAISEAITALGGSLHSIDEVVVAGAASTD